MRSKGIVFLFQEGWQMDLSDERRYPNFFSEGTFADNGLECSTEVTREETINDWIDGTKGRWKMEGSKESKSDIIMIK